MEKSYINNRGQEVSINKEDGNFYTLNDGTMIKKDIFHRDYSENSGVVDPNTFFDSKPHITKDKQQSPQDLINQMWEE